MSQQPPPAPAGLPPKPFDPMDVLVESKRSPPTRQPRPTRPGAISIEPELMACDFCGGEVVRDAIKCKHCGEFLRQPAMRTPLGSGKFICSDCGTRSDGTRYTPGAIGWEIVLWLLLFVPGFCYSVWRIASRYTACSACKSRNLVPVGTPRGKELVERFAGR